MKRRQPEHPPQQCYRCREWFIPRVAVTAYCSPSCANKDAYQRRKEGGWRPKPK